MVFWGLEVKPGKPYMHNGAGDGEYEGSRLHLSQATLGLDGKGKERTVVKCKVGDGPELLLCSLTPGVSESCSLDLLFDQDVVFSVTGSTSVHLVGYYMPLEDEREEDDDEDYDGLDSEDDEDDEDSDEDVDLYAPPTSVMLQELDDDGNPLSSEVLLIEDTKPDPESPPVGESKKAAKRRKKAAAAAAKDKANGSSEPAEKQVVEEESEDEDGFALLAKPEESPAPSTASKESKKETKKRKKKEKTPTQAEGEKSAKKTSEDNGTLEKTPAKTPTLEKTPAKTPTLEKTPAKTSTPGTDTKRAKKASPAVRKFPNGLEIEELAMGKPDARQTKPGKKVSVYYTGKLKSTGKVFDSNVGKKPFGFRLGVGEVIKGWDVGVTGMRIGDKRKITVPPAMGYQAKGIPGVIPGNSWLVFDVEVTDVAK